MFFSIILIFVFVITIFVLGYKKHFTWTFCLYFIGIALLIFSSILYTLKFSTSILENKADSFLYYMTTSKFSFINSNITTVSSLLNFGLMLIMLASAFITKIVNPSAKKTFWFIIAYTAFFGFSNYHKIKFREFILINSIENEFWAQNCKKILSISNTVSLIMFVLVLFLPFVFLLRIIFYSKIYSRRKDSTTTLICLTLINLFVLYYFAFGHYSPFMPWNVTLLKFPTQPVITHSKAFIMQIIILLSLTVLYVIIRYNPFAAVKFQTKNERLKEYFELNHSLRMIFHVNKNILYSVELLAGQAMDFWEKNIQISYDNLKEIKNIAKSSQTTLSRMLTMLDDISAKNTTTNLIEAMEKALSQISIPQNIKIVKKYGTDMQINIKAASVHITESFTNILLNSIDAIELKGNNDGCITISIYTENEYAAVEVEDNGCGIKKKDLKYIFNMLSSTKKSSTNWGIGLAYVKKVSNVYGGNLFVKSEYGSYTVIQIDFRRI